MGPGKMLISLMVCVACFGNEGLVSTIPIRWNDLEPLASVQDIFMHTLVNCKCILWCFKSQVITCKMVLTPHTLSWRFIWEISQVINLKLQAGNEKCNWQFGVYETENNIGQPWIDYLLAGAELLNHHYFYACQCKISNFTGWNGVIAACWQISSQDKGFWVFPFIQRHKECLYLIFFNPARHVDYLRTFLRFNFELGFPFSGWSNSSSISGWSTCTHIRVAIPDVHYEHGIDFGIRYCRYIPGNLNW